MNAFVAREIANAADRLGRTEAVVADIVDDLADLGHRDRLSQSKVACRCLRVAQHRAQRLRDLVSNHRGELPHGRETRGVSQVLDRFLGTLAVRDVMTDRLKLLQLPSGVEYRMIGPLMPAPLAAGQDHFMLVDIGLPLRGGEFHLLERHRARFFGKQLEKGSPDQLFLRHVEMSAVRGVHKGQRGIGKKTAHEIRLSVDHLPITLFAVAKEAFRARHLIEQHRDQV